MPIRILTAAAGSALAPAEVELVSALVGRWGRLTVLAPDGTSRDLVRRDLARAGAGIGIDVTTPTAWIAALWELFGDGRRPVDAMERRLVMGSVAFAGGGRAPAGDRTDASAPTPGEIEMLAEAARDVLPGALAEGAAVRAALSPGERRVVARLARYAERLRDLGLVEACAAADLLARTVERDAPACCRCLVARDLSRYPAHLLRLIGTVARVGEVLLIVDESEMDLARDLGRRLGGRIEPLGGGDAASAPAADVPARAAADACRAEVLPAWGPTAHDATVALAIERAVAAAADDAGIAPDDAGAAPDDADGTAGLVIADEDPLAACRRLAPRLAAAGIALEASGTVMFGDTRAGEMLACLGDLAHRVSTEEPAAWWPAPELPDWLRSPFSGLGRAGSALALALDKWLRRTRSIDRDRLLARLAQEQSRAQQRERVRAEEEGRALRAVCVSSVFEALVAGKPARAVALMRATAAEAPASAFGTGAAADQVAELAALDGAVELFERARALGVPEAVAFAVLPQMPVRRGISVAPEGAPRARARVMRLADAASLMPGGAAALVVADASAEARPLQRRDTAASVLAAKLGWDAAAALPLGVQRARFRRALAVPHAACQLVYAAFDAHGDERYVAVAVAEMIAAGSVRTVRAADLPAEDALQENASCAHRPVRSRVAAPAEHALAPGLERFLLIPERVVGGERVPRTLSASQIENYLACPYRWLVSNRVATRRLDVGFGPIEMGNFVHDVMQRFHERLLSCGLCRVTPQTVGEALAEMDAAFDEVRRDHAAGRHLSAPDPEKRSRRIPAPLVPLGELERNRFEAQRAKLHEVVRYEADMLSIFEPARFEYAFDRDHIGYAGRAFGGRIDRIDVAPDAGRGERFVVIDYKNRSGLSDLACPDPTMRRDEGEPLGEGWLPGRDEDRSPKIQTLVYATALERAGLGCAQGAVYFGTRGPAVAGAVDAALVESEPPAFPHGSVSGYPGAKPRGNAFKRDGSMSFHQLLEQVERACSRELDRLEAGRIAPDPAKDSCAWCPVAMCERRR